MNYPHIHYEQQAYSNDEMLQRSTEFYQWLDKRRTVRHFSNRTVPRQIIENLLLSASTAPSGAHKQPWTYCAIDDPNLKKQIRKAAEEEEYRSYNGRMSAEWLQDLEPIGTDWQKPFLEIAPWIIVVFRRIYEPQANGTKRSNYYVNESVGLSVGLLLAAIHHAGLVALTHTPSPMNFLCDVLQRPTHEKPFVLIPIGYAAENATVPDLRRKDLNEIAVFYSAKS